MVDMDLLQMKSFTETQQIKHLLVAFYLSVFENTYKDS